MPWGRESGCRTAVDGFEGLVAVVTGGASGIGAACVRALHEGGADVGVLDLDPDVAPSMVSVARVKTDVSNAESVEAAMEYVAALYGGIDILVTSAGTIALGDVTANDDDEWARVLDVNVVGVARACRVAIPYLRSSAYPAIVTVSSVAATAGLPRRALYSASKGAVHALTMAMAADLASEGIRVNCVVPGAVAAQQVAAAVTYLAGPLSRATTGTALVVDGI